MINSVADICKEVGCHQDDHDRMTCGRSVENRLYKASSCGVVVGFILIGFEKRTDDGGIVIGGYCEGVDWEIPPRRLPFPFTAEQLWETLALADKDGCEVWDETHGCDDCNGYNEETGYHAIHPTCETCNGQGVVF